MSFSKALLAALCLFCLAIATRAENKNDSRSRSDSTSEEVRPKIPSEIGGKSYKQWKEDLSHPDPSVRANAISVIPGFREDAEDSIPLIVDRTRDRDASPRVKAVLALKIMGIRGPDIPRVVKALGERISSDTQAIVRYEAAQALTRFGVDTREVVADLVRGVGDTSTWELRHACIVALIVAGVDPKKGPDVRVSDALLLRTQTLHEPTVQVRLEAIMALGAMGRPQDPTKLKQVLTALKANYNSQNKVIRIWAHVSTMALEEKVNEKYLDVVADYLKDRERDIKVQAVTALGALQEKAHAHVGDICKMLQYEKDPPVLSAACSALGRMGDRSERVRRALIRQTERDGTDFVPVVLSACNALAQIGVPDADVMDALKNAKENKALDSRARDMIDQAIKDVRKPRDLDKKRKAEEKKDDKKKAP